ncbi:hypothetical protein B0H67DRAFT_638898 [Lasiosphaeris hirsuta]|uniref:Uncharacterized protein n=1 Tax=Lasiosphaeris hirsuta TaxID=260670 RepID=A0AA40E6T5_9PEZI|nr:hypothetical protein B0H67DRAFT_638898 [Lasiosphaeris hirsuta]
MAAGVGAVLYRLLAIAIQSSGVILLFATRSGSACPLPVSEKDDEKELPKLVIKLDEAARDDPGEAVVAEEDTGDVGGNKSDVLLLEVITTSEKVYKSSLLSAPQNSKELPLHTMLHEVEACIVEPAPSVFP